MRKTVTGVLATYLLTSTAIFGALNPCDIGPQDGIVNSDDVNTAVSMVIGQQPCTANINGSNVCTVVTVQRIVNAVLGGSCVTDVRTVNLNWTASVSSGVVGYNVYRSNVSGTSYSKLNASPVNATTYSDSTVQSGQTYYYVARAVAGSGLESINSNETTAAIDVTVVPAPVNLQATAASTSQINLTWSATTASGYRIERCQGAACTNFVQIGTSVGTNYSDTGLATATSYNYRVRAVDGSGNLSSYSNVVIGLTMGGTAPAGLVAAYSFNEGSGSTLADASGNANIGTISGPLWTTQGKYGSALNFDGVDDLVLINSSSSLNLTTGLTLEAWVNPTGAQSGWRTVMQREVDAYFLHASSGEGALVPAGGGTFNGTVDYVAGASANAVNTWTHLASTYDGTTLRLYVNGNQVGAKSLSGLLQSTTTPVRIGGNSPYGEFFKGIIDEVRVYNRALSQSEIQQDMARALQ